MKKYLYLVLIIPLLAIISFSPQAESYLAIPPTTAFSGFLSDVFGVNLTAKLSTDTASFVGGDLTFFPSNNTINFGPSIFDVLSGFNATLPVLVEGDQIDFAIVGNTTEISVEDCSQDEVMVYDSGAWECATAQSITINFGLDNTERLYAHLSRGTAGDNTFTFGVPPTEYQIRFHEFSDGGGMGGGDEYASWYSVAQLGFNASAPLEFSYYYTTEKVGNGEPFCLQVDIWAFEAEGGDLDATVEASNAFCDYTPPPPDILEKGVHVFTGAEHSIEPLDFIIMNLGRFGASNSTDTGDYKVYISDPEVRWNIP